MDITVEEIIKNNKQLASLPEIFIRINEAINSPNLSYQYMGDLVSEDGSLSSRLLKIANSSFYNFPGEIDSVSMAMSIIGTQELRDIILATTIFDMFSGIDLYGLKQLGFWQHSIACAVAARVIAIHRRELNPEMFYVAGILHQVGRLLIAEQCSEQYTEILRAVEEDGQLLIEKEMEVLGFNHCDVGAALVRNWMLGEFHQECVHYHWAPHLAHLFPVGVATIHLADIIVTAMDIGDAKKFTVRPLDDAAWQLLAMNGDALPEIIDMIDEQYDDAAEAFLGKG